MDSLRVNEQVLDHILMRRLGVNPRTASGSPEPGSSGSGTSARFLGKRPRQGNDGGRSRKTLNRMSTVMEMIRKNNSGKGSTSGMKKKCADLISLL